MWAQVPPWANSYDGSGYRHSWKRKFARTTERPFGCVSWDKTSWPSVIPRENSEYWMPTVRIVAPICISVAMRNVGFAASITAGSSTLPASVSTCLPNNRVSRRRQGRQPIRQRHGAVSCGSTWVQINSSQSYQILSGPAYQNLVVKSPNAPNNATGLRRSKVASIQAIFRFSTEISKISLPPRSLQPAIKALPQGIVRRFLLSKTPTTAS